MITSILLICCVAIISFAGAAKIIESEAKFDFVIVGGGVAGLALASRLSEKAFRVLVLEAGGDGRNNPNISIPGNAGTAFFTPIDWNFHSVPQKHANGTSIYLPRGKVLGGSSAINFMINTKASKQDYDGLEAIGNSNWNFLTIDAAFKKVEKLFFPSKGSNYTYIESFHGENGNVPSSFPQNSNSLYTSYLQAIKQIGHVTTKDAFGGNATGAWIYPSAISANRTRVTSANAYYYDHAEKRSNLRIELNAEVEKLLSESKNNVTRVVAVQYRQNKKLFTVSASREVILCAGSIMTPAILERSGFGDKNILSKFNIPMNVHLPGVGNNLVDHACITTLYSLKTPLTPNDKLNGNKSFFAEQLELYQTKKQGLLADGYNVLDYQSLSMVVNSSEMKEGLKLIKERPDYLPCKVYEQIVSQIKSGAVIEFIPVSHYDDAKFLPDKNTSYMGVMTCLQFPFSRGSVHIQSNDYSAPPAYDPNYFSNPFDLWLLSKAALHSRRIMRQPVLKDIIRDEVVPGAQTKTHHDWVDFVHSRVRTEFHPFGTASMLPRDQNGVVDSSLRVYGTENLRVVDASIIPYHISAHPTLTIYAIAEIAAGIILKD